MRQSIRCHIVGEPLPAGYFEQDMALADGKNGFLYLRIGNDVYEGQTKKNSMNGTVIHLAVDPDIADDGTGTTAKNGNLTSVAVSEEEYVFWPTGKMESVFIKSEADLDMEMDQSISALPDISLDSPELATIAEMLGNFSEK